VRTRLAGHRSTVAVAAAAHGRHFRARRDAGQDDRDPPPCAAPLRWPWRAGCLASWRGPARCRSRTPCPLAPRDQAALRSRGLAAATSGGKGARRGAAPRPSRQATARRAGRSPPSNARSPL